MEEKKSLKISLSTFLLLIAILVIIVMAYFMYKLNNEKNAEIQKVTKLNNQVSSLESTTKNLQGKIDNVSNIVNNDSNKKDNNTNEKVSNEDNNTKIKNDNTKQEKVVIPEANTNLTKEEEKLISEYFGGVWVIREKKWLAIEQGKRFCEMNFDGSNKEYGTFSFEKDDTAIIGYTIILNYNSGKKEKLRYVEGSGSYLETNDGKTYEEDYKYFFGSEGDDEGVFSKQ